MRRRAFALAILCTTACGRGQLEPIGIGGGLDGAAGTDISILFDGGLLGKDVPDFDTGPIGLDGNVRPDSGFRPDSGIRPDAGPRPDGGFPDGGPQCLSEIDCFNALGLPPCPNGSGSWACTGGVCQPLCGMPPVCRNDCECPFDLVCQQGACAAVQGRPNFCCANPMCRPGSRCVQPDGSPGRCNPATPDAGVPADGGMIGNPCMDDCDCDRFLACANGTCMALNRANQCCDAPFCPPGQMCIDPATRGPSMCMGPPPPPVVPVGAACTAGGPECMGGFCIDETNGFPGGYCSTSCTPGDPMSCPGDGVCRGTGQGQAICLDGCTDTNQCRSGYACVQLGVSAGGRVCWPLPPGSMNPNGNPVGGACTQDQECASGLTCIDESQGGFPGGYCTRPYCDPVTNACPSGSDCYAFPGLFSLCLAECPLSGSQSTCRAGYYCLGPSGQPGVCIGN